MKLLLKPFTMLASALAGVLAGVLFTRLWRAATGDDQPPPRDSTEHRAREVLLGAMVQGAVFAGVKAAVDQVSARGVRHLTDQAERGAERVRAGQVSAG
ncbi:MAG TPA: DUF4235 domain-containing protein [Pseudonocardia sp.]|jgi:hypothetical protein|nr:DUF4235 domain-containing protein [Pseudonocardia sp.]